MRKSKQPARIARAAPAAANEPKQIIASARRSPLRALFGGKRLPLINADVTYVNGLRVGATHGWDRPRRYELPAGALREGENLIVVRVEDTGGDGGIWGDADGLYLEVGGTRYDLAGEWLYRPSAMPAMFGIAGGSNYANPNSFASLLYNGMIAPLVGYGIKGAVWYQGENNAGRAQSYRRLFPLMIRDWRGRWGYEFPFCWVQLANYMQIAEQPGQSEWAELREAQNLTLELPATGQADSGRAAYTEGVESNG